MSVTSAWSTRPVQPIGVPLYLGADQHGAELSPAVLDDALRFRLRRWGFDDILARVAPLITVTPPPSDPAESRGAFERARHLPAIAAVCTELARVVQQTIATGALAVMLGGDHSLSIGSLAGSTAASGRLAVIWFDAHGDVNTPATSPSGHIHGMPLAVALGVGDARLTGILSQPPRAEDIYMIGVRELDPGERQFLRARPVHVYTAHTVSQVGIRRILDDIQADLIAKPIDAVHISFDMDVVDPVTLPGTGAKAFGGLSFREANFALKRLRDSGLPIVAADFVELNPLLDVAGRSVEIAAHLLATFLGEDIL